MYREGLNFYIEPKKQQHAYIARTGCAALLIRRAPRSLATLLHKNYQDLKGYKFKRMFHD